MIKNLSINFWGYSDALYSIMTKKNQLSDFCNVTVGHLFIEHVLRSILTDHDSKHLNKTL